MSAACKVPFRDRVVIALVVAILTAGIFVWSIPPRVHAGSTVSCANPSLHPVKVVAGTVPVRAGANPAVIDNAIDTRGNIAWAVEGIKMVGEPPAHPYLYLYNAKTGRVSPISSKHLHTLDLIGRIALSTHWLVYGLAANTDGSDWRIIAHNLATGGDRIIAHGWTGGVADAQLDVDGDIVTWVQPTDTAWEIHAENLVTGTDRILSSVALTDSVYTWLSARNGHVTWQWMHLRDGQPVTDIMAAPEDGGPAIDVTTDGHGSQPANAWPWIAYIKGVQFSQAHDIEVRNMGSGASWTVHSTGVLDAPRIGADLLVYNPGLPQGAWAVQSLRTRESIALKKEKQADIQGVGFNGFNVCGRTMVANGIRYVHVHGKWTSSDYVVPIFHVKAGGALQSILSCR